MNFRDNKNCRPYVMPYEMPGLPMELFPAEEVHATAAWLIDAMPLSVYGSHSRRLNLAAKVILRDIEPLIKVSSKHRIKEAIKTIVTNLFLTKLENKPVRYSRNKNDYVRDRRYGKLHYKYDRIIPIVDAMEKMGYLQQKRGFYVSSIGDGKQTRMWGTPYLWSVLQYHSLVSPSFYHKSRPEELIVLRDEKKNEIGYQETRFTRQARADLERYNKYVDEHTITLKLKKATRITRRFLVELYRNILNRAVSITQMVVTRSPIIQSKSITNYSKNPISITNSYNNYSILQIIQSYTTPPTMTNTNCIKRTMDLGLREIDGCRKRFLNYLHGLCSDMKLLNEIDTSSTLLDEEFTLGELGVDVLEIVLHYECMHRVFNKKSFDKGGRAYGALHQSLPSNLRPYIRINGDRTTEVDYSAFHILMLYHKEGIDYPGDPYRACGGDDLRKTFKIAALVFINAKNETKAMQAIRKELEKNGIPLPKVRNPLKWLVRRFKEVHEPIQKHLCSGVGLSLQNKDSHIMNTILMRLLDRDILGLSVYDSVIVAEQHKDVLRQIMVEAYKEVMGFKPRL